MPQGLPYEAKSHLRCLVTPAGLRESRRKLIHAVTLCCPRRRQPRRRALDINTALRRGAAPADMLASRTNELPSGKCRYLKTTDESEPVGRLELRQSWGGSHFPFTVFCFSFASLSSLCTAINVTS